MSGAIAEQKRKAAEHPISTEKKVDELHKLIDGTNVRSDLF